MRRTINIDKFNGIAEDIRDQSFDLSAMAHWETNQRFSTLTPLREMAIDQSGATFLTYKIQDVLYSNNFTSMFGLGVAANGDPHATIYEKSSISTPWAPSTNANGTAGTVIQGTLCEYNAVLYCLTDTGADAEVVSYDPATDTFDETAGTLTGCGAASYYPRPMRHSKTDILFFGAANKLWKKDGAGSVLIALTLPTNLTITSLTEYGNYLAIATAPNGTNNMAKSYVYLWDMVSSDVQEVIEWGDGQLMILENIGGALIGIMQTGITGFTNYGYSNVIFQEYNGGKPRIIKELVPTVSTLPLLYTYKATVGQILYFPMKYVRGGTTMWQIFSLSKNRNGQYVVRGSCLPNNDTAPTAINGLSIIYPYFYVAINGDGTLMRNIESLTFGATSYIETIRYDCGDRNQKKRLTGVAVSTAYLPTAATVKLEYRKNEQTSWVDISTNTTDNSVSREDIKEVANAKNLPEFYEIQFRIESTGGAEITGLKFTYEPIKTLLDTV